MRAVREIAVVVGSERTHFFLFSDFNRCQKFFARCGIGKCLATALVVRCLVLIDQCAQNICDRLKLPLELFVRSLDLPQRCIALGRFGFFVADETLLKIPDLHFDRFLPLSDKTGFQKMAQFLTALRPLESQLLDIQRAGKDTGKR